MKYFYLEPEVAGELGEHSLIDTSVHPPHVFYLHYEFDGWLGDDLLQSFPCYIITERLKTAFDEVSPSGCIFAFAEVSKSEIFNELYPNRELPEFFWLQVIGRAGKDDFGLSKDCRLVVSNKILQRLNDFNLHHCQVNEY